MFCGHKILFKRHFQKVSMAWLFLQIPEVLHMAAATLLLHAQLSTKTFWARGWLLVLHHSQTPPHLRLKPIFPPTMWYLVSKYLHFESLLKTVPSPVWKLQDKFLNQKPLHLHNVLQENVRLIKQSPFWHDIQQ